MTLKQILLIASLWSLSAISFSQITVTDTFNYTGTVQTLVVPNGVDSITVDVRGAQGGSGFWNTNALGSGGLGGRTIATIPVTAGETLRIYVGGQGTGASATSPGSGGFNGGANGGQESATTNSQKGGGGGGASDIRSGGTALSNRIVVGGGGGGASVGAGSPNNGAVGGGLTGGTGAGCCGGTMPTGGTQSAGGGGGFYSGYCGASAGTLGNGASGCTPSGGGGGGGGYYGGGGGAWASGGGGSGYITSSASQTTLTSGYQTGNGVVYITYSNCALPTIASPFIQTVHSRQVTYSNVDINSTGNNVAFVSPGESISLSFNYAIVQNGTYCPGCVVQYYVGIYGFWQDCYRNTGGYCNCSGSESFTITAPTTPGIYYFTEGRGLSTTCAGGNTSVENSTNGLAAIIVRETFSSNIVDETCVGDLDGMITMTADSASTGNTYLWSTGSTSNPITGIGPGVYNVTSTDAFGCNQVDTIEVSTDTVPPVARAYANRIVYLNASGNASITAVNADSASSDDCDISLKLAEVSLNGLENDFIWLGNRAGHSYFRSRNTANFATSTTNASSISGYLSSVTSLQEDEFVHRYLGTEWHYIGLNDITTEGTFVWANGEPLSYTGWGAGEPNNSSGGEDCATLNVNDDKWNDVGCSIGYRSLVERNDSVETSNSIAFSCADTGNHSYTLIATDEGGLIGLDTLQITVLDTMGPTISLNPLIVYLNASGSASITAAMLNNGTTDNCALDSIFLDQNSFDCGDAGNPSVTFYAVDVHGNQRSAAANVTVIDTISPLLFTQNRTIYLDSTGIANISADTFDAGSSDICGISSFSIDSSNFNCASHGDTVSIVFSATDSSGNTTSTIVEAYILDTLAPIISTTMGTVVLNPSGEVSIDYTLFDNGTFDNCGISNISLSNNLVNCSALDTAQELWFIAEDINGNSDSALVYVSAIDTTAPIIACADSIIVNNALGQCGANLTIPAPTADDNCGIDSIIQIDSTGLSSGSFFPVGITELIYAAYDKSGNTDTCSIIIKVFDTETPTLNCPNDTLICDSIFIFNLPTYSDNCSGLAVQQIAGIESGNAYPLGLTTNRFAISDNYGNTDTCEFEVVRFNYPSAAVTGPDTSLCEVFALTLNATPPVVGTGSWKSVSGSVISGDSSSSSINVTSLNYGVNSFSWTISNGVCPVQSDTINVIIFSDTGNINAGIDQVLCDTTATTLNATSTDVGNLVWLSPIGGAVISDSTSLNPIVTGLSLGDFQFIWSLTNGVCPAETDTVHISVKPQPTVTASDSAFIFSPSTVDISAESDIAQRFIWFDEKLDAIDSGEVITVQPNSSQTYIVNATTEFGCIAIDSVYIGVNQTLQIPTAFTPDKDGFNDNWNLKELSHYPDCTVRIFNRWGHTIFTSDGYTIPWDGTLNGEQLPTGAYFFVIDLKVNEVEPLTGSVTIIR